MDFTTSDTNHATPHPQKFSIVFGNRRTTFPFDQKHRFQRSKFKELDPKKWVPDLF